MEIPRREIHKIISDVDGVSGATASWEEGNIKINYDQDPTIQALEDFRSSIINNTTPLSNVNTGACIFAVQMGIDAMDKEQVISWNTKYNI